MANPQPGRAPQAEILASEGQDVGIDLADLLASTWIRGGKRPSQRTRAASDVQDAPGSRDVEHDPQPAHVVELEVRDISEIDVRSLHPGLAQQPPRRPPGIHLGDQIPPPGEGPRALLSMRHADRLTHRCAFMPL
jgi:hypothetical protein